MYKCEVETELKINHKWVKSKCPSFDNEMSAKEELNHLYKKYLEEWKDNKILYDNNGIFCFIIDRENGNEFKARLKNKGVKYE